VTDAGLASGYLRKARRALSGARLLLQAGDTEGACNRAYFAMFDAAHAALIFVGAERPDAPIKTHNGLIGVFGQHLVLGNHLPAEYGENFNKVQRLRQLADYTGDPVEIADATWAVDRAEAFVRAIAEKFSIT
jgi:uncharacterized protein (UPF0332 family)